MGLTPGPEPAPQQAPRPARPEITQAVCRGACRLMRQSGLSVLLEVPLPDGRRADIFALGRGGEITIIEVKSSIEDWRVDYNANRPHSAHGELTPAEFALQWTTTHQPQVA